MGDYANDHLRGWVRAGMPRGAKGGKPCPHCGYLSATGNRCHPSEGMFCPGSGGYVEALKRKEADQC